MMDSTVLAWPRFRLLSRYCRMRRALRAMRASLITTPNSICAPRWSFSLIQRAITTCMATITVLSMHKVTGAYLHPATCKHAHTG